MASRSPRHLVTAIACALLTTLVPLSTSGSLLGAETALAASCKVPTALHPTVASAVADPNCPVIDLAPLTYSESGIVVGHNVTLNGHGATIDGGSSGSSVFRVNPGVTFNVNNLRIQHANVVFVGTPETFGGGAIFNYGTLKVDKGTFLQNTATAGGLFGSGAGGAILDWAGATTTVKNSVFDSNTAAFGGAIYNLPAFNNLPGGQLTILDSQFTHNTAPNSGDDGGAIEFDNGFLLIDGSTFYQNRANDIGGAITAYGPCTIMNSRFIENHADFGGGALNLQDQQVGGKVTVSSDTFIGNTSPQGGAIRSSPFPSQLNSLLVVTNGTFKQNRSTLDGGALWNASPVSIKGSTFEENAAQGRGGGIFNSTSNGTLALSGSQVEENQGGTSGGGIYNDGGQVTLTRTSVSNNVPDNCAPPASVPGCS